MPKLIERVQGILLAPEPEWAAIANGPGHPGELFLHYVAPLALIPAVARFLGAWLIGGYMSFGSGLLGAAAGFLFAFVAILIVALVTNALAPIFLAQRNLVNALNLAVYSYTPVWLAGVFLLIPGLSFLTVIGLYGAYPLWLGLPILMQTPRDKALSYAGAVLGCALVVAILVEVAQMALFGRTR